MKAKEFLVSTANFQLYYNDILACTGTTNLNSSIEVSMQEQNVNAGKLNKLIYSFKYGRELAVTLEAADWKLEYIAANVGTDITAGLADMYVMGECLTITDGIGVLPSTPLGDVAVELQNGVIITVKPEDTTIDLTANGVTSGTVNVTYQVKKMAKSIIIDAETTPKIYKLVLDADKCNNKLGKIGNVQIVVPSYQPSGNFTINFTPDGVTSTNIDGKSLAVEGDTCESGNAVYAYINEFEDAVTSIAVADIAVSPSVIALEVEEEKELSVIGLRGGLYSPVEIENADCEFVSEKTEIATVTDGKVKGVKDGKVNITVSYEGCKDVVEVTVGTGVEGA